MGVIYEKKFAGGGAVRIHDDDAVQTEEEKQAIINAVSRVYINHYRREARERQKRQREQQG